MVWVGAVLAYLSLARLNGSRLAASPAAYVDSETGATAVGINLITAKVRVFAVSAVYMGFAGFLCTHISCNTSAQRASASTSQFLWCPWSSSVNSAIQPACWWERWY